MDCTVKYDNVTELMMHEALNSVNDGIVIVDKTSRILYVNDAYAKILAVSKDKVLYKQVKTIEPGALILKVLKNGTPIFHRKRKINQCIEKASDLCYPFFISLRL